MKPQSLTITQAEIDFYARLTNDANPIHTDPDFAASTAMGGTIAHGTMSLGLLWIMIEDLCPGNVCPARLRVRFTAPVRPGDTVTAGGELSKGTGDYSVWVRNQRGETIIGGKLELSGELQA
ncbi:MAG: MaoC family dehydratase [Aquamicrobium sp.]|uniref:MaoC family dehydratase n=1 Tax=Aquamicrobium sp. TaxID=1872579 RepID=UPI00349ED99E|nr:MaoC family dehydratase [Aquamicrobium sp.]